MAGGAGGRRRRGGGLDVWPGYVDALSTLLMVIIFVLLVFVLAQGFLSVALSSRDRALDRLNRQVSELSELLALERGQAEELRGNLSRTAEELAAAATMRDALQRSLLGLREERDRLAQERDATRGERDRLAARVADLEIAARGGTDRVAALEQRLAEALARAEAVGGDVAQTAQTLVDARRLLAAERAALEAARRDLAAAQAQGQALTRDLAEARDRQQAAARDLSATEARSQALMRELAEARAQQQTAARDLTAAQAQSQALTRDLAEARDRQQATARDLAAAQAQGQVATRDLEARRREAETLAAELAAARTALDAARRDLAALREEAARLDQTVRADRTTIEARLSDIARLSNEIRALTALRDELERRARDALARAEDEARRRQQAEAQGGEFARLSESARAQAALLAQQIEVLRAELARVGAALDAAETATRDRDVQIANLGQRLNAALAQRVEELQSYRSDFFGRLRRVLGDRPEVRIVGDRFVFQSEVLFPAGSAELSETGQQQIRNIGRVLQDIARQFPPDLNWVLRVDGHADRTPVRGGRFASNWELSSARAIAVAQLLIAEGLAPNRVAATAFGDTQPLDERETPDAYARNRRIELRLEPVPVAPPAATQAPPDPRRAAREVLGALACARVTVTEEAGGLRVAGVARRGAEAELRAALQSRAAAGVLAGLDIRPFGESLCEVVEALRPVPIAPGNAALRLQVVGREPLAPGSLLRTDIAMPDWAGQLLLFYIATDGQVVRLAALDRQAAGARFRLGEPRGPFTGWPVVEPFGTELLVAIASEGPLFQPARPEAEPVRSFAPALATAVETARREGRRLAVQVVPVETGP